MAKKTFMPRTDLDKQQWLQNFAGKLNAYASKYVISAADITDMQTGSAYFTYWLSYKTQFEEYLKKLTKFKNELRDGIPPGSTASVAPAPPTMSAAPATSTPGLFVRATAIAMGIKKKSNYTEADGNDLGIEGAEDTNDLQSMKPVLLINLINGGQPEIKWKKQGMDGIDFYVDRGDGNWVFLATDTYPDYTDTFSLPAGTVSAVWKYKGIYRFDDAHVGLWSDVASISVAI